MKESRFNREQIYQAARTTLELFRSGKVKPFAGNDLTEGAMFFDMGLVAEFTEEQNSTKKHGNETNTKCGTVACIGGWMGVAIDPVEARSYNGIALDELISADDLTEDERIGLDELFFNWLHRSENFPYASNEIPLDVAAKALKTWIEGNYENNPWDVTLKAPSRAEAE